jgi:large subunit ribosomal protein L4
MADTNIMEAKIYNQKGKETDSIALPAEIFGVPWNGDMVHQVITSLASSARAPVAHTKNRGEVSGGGKKPWQQKGTGRARHGSTRSPIWVGGGVAHGPRNEINRFRKVNKKMKDKALRAIISRKFKDGEILFVDSLSFTEPKTKEALGVVTSLAGIKGYERLANKKVNAAFIALPKKDRTVEKSFNNFSNIEVGEIRNINPFHALNYKFLIIADPKEAFKTLA